MDARNYEIKNKGLHLVKADKLFSQKQLTVHLIDIDKSISDSAWY